MSKSCKPLHPGLFLLGAATAALVFAAPQTCAEAFRQGLALCGGPLLVSLFPFLVVSALIMRSGAGEVLGVLLWPVVRCIGLRSRSAGSVLLIGLVGGFAPAAAATAEAVRSRELTSQEASALLPACICSGPSFVILTVGEQLLGSRTAGVCLFAAQVLAGWLTAALLCRVRGIPEPLPAPPAAAQTEPPPALDTILAQAAVTYLKLCGFVLYFRLLAAGCGLLLPAVFAPFPAMLLQVRTLCPPEVSLRSLLWGRLLHLPLSLALFYLGLPQSAVESFNTLCARVVPMQRVPTDCALLVFAVCCITACEACRLTEKKAQNAVPANKNCSAACKPPQNVVT